MTKVKDFIIRHKKLLIILAVVLLIVFIARSVFSKKDKGEVLAKAETTELKKKNFENSIRESGEAISEDSATVFSERQLPVEEINVEVGDKVEKDQIIARLDDSSIRQQIAQRQASIAATNSSASAQIKNAQNRLSDASKNLEKGTNAGIVAANNAVIAAYDQWQSAEKIYDDYQRSLNSGYNTELVQEDSGQKTVDDTLDSAKLNYDQSVRKYSNLQDDIRNAQSKLRSASSRADDLKRRQSDLNLEIGKLENSGSSANTQDLIYDLRNELIDIQMKINSVGGDENNAEELKKSLYERKEQIEKQIDSLESQGSNPQSGDPSKALRLQNELKDVSADLASAQADVSKYEAEIETLEKQLDPSKMEIEQQNLALNKAKSDQDLGKENKEKSKMTRQDQLDVYRKNAQDLKSAYESALKNLDSAEEAAKDEISALKNSVSIAKSSANTGVESADLKFLYEELEKTVIRAPIEGTITQVNVEDGQVPADYIAKIDTVDRIVVKTKVKEFDLNRLKLGLDAEITSDALGKSKVFHGKVESINPTPITNQGKGQGQDLNEVYYEVKVSLDDDKDKEIKPGMTLKVKYVFEKKKDVYVVPIASIYEKGSKNFVLYLDKDSLNKKSQIKEMPVIIRDNNDYEAVITSEKDISGIKVINSPDKYSAGMEVTLTEDSGD
jgi:HlyD family secretion protein